ncbi:unannotated protein [freshwater metagenome]|uniref:Unannotated protein n=1 Tax=freshwater metagenome TaxID=449393 RepID=A0A6J7IGA3_9ZZZZ|nr:class I SAM-dependent methyltransferase [Actinomycetota bacterium]
MTTAPTTVPDPYRRDPAHWGVSLAHMAPLMFPALEAVGARRIVEVGAYAGDLTEVLANWAEGAGAHVEAIDPSPQPGLSELAAAREVVELTEHTSLDAMPVMERPDAIVIDGDHNYFTVRREVEILVERFPGGTLPLVFFHDVCWPHARRDDYFDVTQIPQEYRHPVAGFQGGVLPEEPGLVPGGGLFYERSATFEGGARNGVLTAIEDVVAETPGLRLVVIPGFFGLGALWHTDAPWSAAVEGVLGPWDRHPVLEALEANRVHHLTRRFVPQATGGGRARRLVNAAPPVLRRAIAKTRARVARS